MTEVSLRVQRTITVIEARLKQETNIRPLADTVWGQGGSQSARQGAKDVVSVLAITTGPTTLVVSIGDSSKEFKFNSPHKPRVFFVHVPFAGRAGVVTLEMNGKMARGPPITNECGPCGYVTFNCTAIEV